MTVQEIDDKIIELKKSLTEIPEQPAEVYTRIVGYYRPVKNWNKGKKDEYGKRKLFTLPKTTEPEVLGVADMAGDIPGSGDIPGAG